jgi:hypothetical protein
MSFRFGIFALALAAASLVQPALADDQPVKAQPATSLLPFFMVNDNRLTIAYQATGVQPGFPGTTARQVYAFTHFDTWAYGTNFVNAILSKSDHNDPAAPCPIYGKGCAGETDFYGIVRSTFGFNEIFKTRAFTWGILRNVSAQIGADVNHENTFQAPSKQAGVVGLQFAFDLPYKGFFNISPLYYKETNHNSYLTPAFTGGGGIPDGNVNFRGTWAVEMNYYMDLGFLPEYLPLSVSGRAKLIGPKGTGTDVVIAGNLPRKTEFYSEPIRLTLDASKVLWGATYSHYLDVWVAYQYWQNKFGLDHELSSNCIKLNAGSCTESTLYTGVTVKF